MTIALYCRVSTDEQALHGFSIQNQKERLVAYCRSQAWDEYKFYVDDGYSGTHLERPQMQQLIHDVKQHHVGTVIVYKLDRLTRKQHDAMYLLEDIFQAHHVVFKSVTEPFDTSTPLGRAMLGILAVFAQLERDTIVERTRSGKNERTRQGLWYGGPVPFGYTWSVDRQQLEIDPTQAVLVRTMFTRFIRKNSYRSISKWLQSQTTDRAFSDHKTLKYMLSNPVYIGKLHLATGLVTALHPAIVEVSDWNKAQNEIKRRQSQPKSQSHHLLSGILSCGVCGSSMQYVSYRRKTKHESLHTYAYYVCTTKHRSNQSPCTSKYWNADVLECAIFAAVQSLIIRQDIVAAIWQGYDTSVQSQNRWQTYHNKLMKVSERLARLHMAQSDDAVISGHISQRIAHLERERALLREQLVQRTSNELTSSNLNGTLISDTPVQLLWGHLTQEEKKQVVESAIVRIEVTADSIQIHWDQGQHRSTNP